jgi:hypothetical protein
VFILPDKMRIDATIASNQKYTIVADVVAGSNRAQIEDIKAARWAQGQLEMWREPELILLKAADPAAKIAPDVTSDRRKPHAVTLTSPRVPRSRQDR